MARKNLLSGLMGPAAETPDKAPAPPPRLPKGIGAVGQSIADLKSRSVLEIPAELIDNAGLEDRLDEDPEGIAALAESIRAYGQQVPVLLRNAPGREGRYEVVYGRRRVAALRLAGLPVRAMLRDLTDRDLMIAQGQENALRRDLSFIEKANFARQMRDTGFSRAVICDALGIDKTLVSRMLTVADAVPLALLHAIGSAPTVGRDRWLELTGRLPGQDPDALAALALGADSDARFEAVFRALTPRTPRPAPQALALTGEAGRQIGKLDRRPNQTVLTLPRDGFDDWLLGRMAQLHSQYLTEKT